MQNVELVKDSFIRFQEEHYTFVSFFFCKFCYFRFCRHLATTEVALLKANERVAELEKQHEKSEDLKNEIETLKNENEALKTENGALKTDIAAQSLKVC